MTTISPEITKRVEDKILETLLLLQQRYPSAKLEIPTYEWNQMGRIAGRAHYFKNLVELNPDYLTKHADELINQTLPHEIAHLVSVKVYGIQLGKGHGRFWKSIMYALSPMGVQVKRCHSYSLEGVNVRTRRVAKPYQYNCNCMTHNVTLNLHTKMQSGRSYTCRRCRSKLVLKALGTLNLSKTAA